MDNQMAYLIGMILGNGEIQQGVEYTTIIIDIPHKKLETDDCRDVRVYVQASLVNIREIIEPLIGYKMTITSGDRSTKISFKKQNEEYIVREIIRLIECGRHHSTMRMNSELFGITTDQKKSLLRGIADVTGYIRKSNIAFNERGKHRVYIEVPENWYLVIDIANILKSIDVPIQTIDFGHPNFRDPQMRYYNEGRVNYWKKEHQIKIFANEFLPIGFNIKNKQQALDKYAGELLAQYSPESTHKFYWERNTRRKCKPIHPGENDLYIPQEIRGIHFESWTDLARALGYGE